MQDSITKENVPRLKKMFEDIEENPSSYEFRDPVPWKELGLNDYPEIIKKPMDLSTCRRNLVKNKYKSYQELFTDMQLIWDNCKTYNIAGSEIYLLAETMEKSCRKIINQCKDDLGIAAKPKKTKTDHDQTAATAQDAEMSEEEVSFEDKVAFTEKVRRMTNQGLTRLVSKVKDICKEALEDVDEEKLQIQVDKIDKESFKKLSDLVDENLVKTKP